MCGSHAKPLWLAPHSHALSSASHTSPSPHTTQKSPAHITAISHASLQRSLAAQLQACLTRIAQVNEQSAALSKPTPLPSTHIASGSRDVFNITVRVAVATSLPSPCHELTLPPHMQLAQTNLTLLLHARFAAPVADPTGNRLCYAPFVLLDCASCHGGTRGWPHA